MLNNPNHTYDLYTVSSRDLFGEPAHIATIRWAVDAAFFAEVFSTRYNCNVYQVARDGNGEEIAVEEYRPRKGSKQIPVDGWRLASEVKG